MSKGETNLNYPLVYILWNDIVSGETGWKTLDEAMEWADNEEGLVHQTGFLVEDDGDHVTLIDSYFKDSETVGTPTKIPKQNVKFIKKISIEEFIK
jgi:hypothetical protein